jgi:hypothetical protein
MKEARIILPTFQRDDMPVGANIPTMLEEKLIDVFGGYTVTVGHGGYRMADGSIKQEPVRVYDVACGEWDNSETLEPMAKWLCKAANQECVYLRLPSGQIKFVGVA